MTATLANVIYKIKPLLILLLITHTSFAQQPKAQSQDVVHQLRIYEIFEHNKAAFHQRFADHAQRIMKTYGFHIVAMWETKNGDRTEFVYLLEWPDQKTLEASWAKFMADEEWKTIKQETANIHGTLVGEIQDRILTILPYSPTKVLEENL